MQRWSASSSADDDSDSSQDTRLHQDKRLKRRQRVKRRNMTNKANSDSNSDYSPSAKPADLAPINNNKNEKNNSEQEKNTESHWSPLKNAFRSLLLSPKQAKPKLPSKRILRSPVTHVYVKGPSGLPTQRVPLGAANFTDFCCVQRSVVLRALLLDP